MALFPSSASATGEVVRSLKSHSSAVAAVAKAVAAVVAVGATSLIGYVPVLRRMQSYSAPAVA